MYVSLTLKGPALNLYFLKLKNFYYQLYFGHLKIRKACTPLERVRNKVTAALPDLGGICRLSI